MDAPQVPGKPDHAMRHNGDARIQKQGAREPFPDPLRKGETPDSRPRPLPCPRYPIIPAATVYARFRTLATAPPNQLAWSRFAFPLPLPFPFRCSS